MAVPVAAPPTVGVAANKFIYILSRTGEGKMKKLIAILAISGVAFLLCSIVACQDNAVPGRESTLSIGQTVTNSGEGLKITFLEVISDSRCPSGLTCIWAGEVVCAVRIEEGTQTSIVDFIQSGNTDDYSQMTYGDYQYTFKVEPYPVSGQEISDKDYRLILAVN
jgi:hypothetical protein